MVRFIKENSVGIFMSRIAVQGDGAVGGDTSSDGNGGAIVSASEDAMMGRMGILVVCRFERLLVEEQVSGTPGSIVSCCSAQWLIRMVKEIFRFLTPCPQS